MPLDVTMPDGTVIQDIPDGTTKQQILEKFRTYKVKQIQSGYQGAGAPPLDTQKYATGEEQGGKPGSPAQPAYGTAFAKDLAQSTLNPTIMGDFSRPQFDPTHPYESMEADTRIGVMPLAAPSGLGAAFTGQGAFPRVPVVSSATDAARGLGNAITSPESLMSKAATLRNATVDVNPSIPVSRIGAIAQGAKAVIRPAANAAASRMESVARFLAPVEPGTSAALNLPDGMPRELPEQPPTPTTPAVGRSMVNKPITAAADTPAEAGGSARPAYTPPENRPPIAPEPIDRAPLGQAQPAPRTVYRPAPDPGLPDMTPPNSAPEINKWLNVSPKELTTGADPGARLIGEKLVGATKEATHANVTAAYADANTQVNTLLKQATANGVTIDAQTPVYDGLGSVEKNIRRPSDSAFSKDVNGVLDSIEGRYPDLARLSPDRAAALRRDLGDAIKWNGEAYDDPVNQAMLKAYRGINKTLKENVPGAAEAIARQQDLLIASKSIPMSMAKDAAGSGTGTTLSTVKRLRGN